MTWEHVAAVPGADGTSVVTVAGALPSVSVDAYRLPELLDAFEPLIGRPVFLRLGAHVELGDDRYLRLLEFDAGDATLETLPLDEAHADLAPEPLRDAFARWLEIRRGAPVPPLRPPWARPGWHARAEAWVGRPLAQYRLWQLSAVLHGGGEFLKAVFSVFHHEPAVTQMLAREHPGDVPDVVRIDSREGWLLMRELRQDGAADDRALETLARIQHAWRARHGELRALGAPDRRLVVLERSLEEHVAAVAPELLENVPALARVCRELAARGEPETLVHGDFHRENVAVHDGRPVIFDWSDACIAHPAIDRHLYAPDAVDDVEAIAGELHQSVSYRAIAAAIPADDRVWFPDEPRRCLERAVARLAQ
ncbi:MAG TPA: phosphotransferase [Gaiellaceae bacterium]|nr:phosphotransferase [Gaiellaceae bacterium]